MFKKRFIVIAAVLAVLLATVAVSRPFSRAPTRLIVVPVTGASEYLDYYQRHAERSAPAGVAADMSDYFARHPELRHEIETSVRPALQNSTIDECFDVSVSELAACRAASQSASQ